MPIGLRSLFRTMLVSAGTHLLILHVVAAVTRDYEVINYFTIIGFSLIWPNLAHGVTNFWLSQAMVASVYLFWFWWLSRKPQE